VIEDFLPPPSELVYKEDTVKVTLGLSRRSVDFFKKQAKKHDTQYQKMIRCLLESLRRETVAVGDESSLPVH
jgi:predicted DNA binding CopG/RHH family protein